MLDGMMKWFAAAVAAVAAFIIAATISAAIGGFLVLWGGSGNVVVDGLLLAALAVLALFGQFALPVLCAIAAYKYFAKKEDAV